MTDRAQGSSKEAILDLFDRTQYEPLTTAEVADEAGYPRRAVRNELDALVDRGTLKTKNVGESERVWWLPPGDRERSEYLDAGVTPDDIAEREKTEGPLFENERRFREMIDSLPEAVYTTDVDGRLTYFNPAAVEFSGRTPELGTDEWCVTWKLFEPDGTPMPHDECPMAVAMTEGRSIRGAEAIAERPDGTRINFEAYPSPLRDDDGRIVGGINMLVDVTERKQTEAQLRQSERKLADFFENATVGMHRVGPEGTILQANQAELDLLGYDRDEYVGQHISDFHVDQDVIDDILERLGSGKELHDYEARMQCKDGSIRHVRISSNVFWDDGEFVNTRCVTRDITERKERDRELERALDLLNKTERIADVAGWEVDPETREPYWSDHLFDLLDVSYDEQPTLEDALDVYYTEEDRTIVEEAIEEALDSGEPFDVETRFPRPSGDQGWLRIQGDPEVVDGEIVSLRGALQDVTERKRRERRLEEVIDRLDASNERLEQFAYAASHDLQEPLRMVSSYLQLLEQRYENEFDEDAEEFLGFAVDGADRMRNMIEGLLAYSRVETKGDPLEPIDLDAVFDDVLADHRVLIEERSAEITADDLPDVEGDASQLRQVFQNVLENAITYSGDEPPRISVSTERDGPEWVVSVSDDGIGIDPDNQDRIFDVFQRLHSRDEYSGTGIGLALCERIIERHGGDIWVDSEPGEGTTVSFTLPPGDT